MTIPTVKIFPYTKGNPASLSEAELFWRLARLKNGQELHIILSVEGRNRGETADLSSELWSLATAHLSNLCLEENEGRIFNPETICEEILKNFNEYLTAWAERNGLDDWNKMAIFFGVMNPVAFYFAKIGDCGAVLLRQGRLIDIDDNLKTPRSPEFSPPFPEIAGGKIQNFDRLIIGSIGFFSSISRGEIPSLADPQSFEVATRNLERISESVGGFGTIAFLIAEISLREETENYSFSRSDLPGSNFSQVGSISFWEYNSLQEKMSGGHAIKENLIPIQETVGALKNKVFSSSEGLLAKLFNNFIFTKIKNLSSLRKAILGTIFLILIFLAGYWNYSFSQKSRDANQTKSAGEEDYDYEKIFTAVDKLEDEAESALIYKDEEKAKKSLFDATEMLSKITNSGDYGIRALKIKKEIEEKMNSLEKNDIFVNSELFWSAPEGRNIDDFAFGGDENLLALTGGELYLLSRGNKENKEKIAESDDFKKENGFFLETKLEVLLLAGEEKNFWLIDGNKKQISTKKEVKEVDFKRSKPVGAFENFVYFWNGDQKQFKQYTLQNGELVFYRDWLKDEVTYFDEENMPIDMAVDGNIFTVSAKGKIYRFSGGKKIDWNNESPVRPLIAKNLKMVTGENLANLYVLDEAKQRIVIFEKESGKLKGQIKNAELAGAIGFKVDESKKEIYFNKLGELRKIVFDWPKEE